MKAVAIVQSSYIPWRGYFDLIRSVDEFILFDDMQYTRRDWRNRNKIKTSQGTTWLTIPVKVKGKFLQKICETEIDDPSWAESHWKSIENNYKRAPHFDSIGQVLRLLYEDISSERMLSQVNHRFLTFLCDLLGISTKISWSMDFPRFEGRTERLVQLCHAAGGKIYLSGPSARDYIEPELFERAGIELRFADYSDYCEYPQLFGDFEPQVSVIDLLFNTGRSATSYMKPLLQQ
ncbi:MAG: WbqC family protein [Blastocatellia bacterium]|nr:WbqC family protein [Blastocatellia bacterium]